MSAVLNVADSLFSHCHVVIFFSRNIRRLKENQPNSMGFDSDRRFSEFAFLNMN